MATLSNGTLGPVLLKQTCSTHQQPLVWKGLWSLLVDEFFWFICIFSPKLIICVYWDKILSHNNICKATFLKYYCAMFTSMFPCQQSSSPLPLLAHCYNSWIVTAIDCQSVEYCKTNSRMWITPQACLHMYVSPIQTNWYKQNGDRRVKHFSIVPLNSRKEHSYENSFFNLNTCKNLSRSGCGNIDKINN